MKRDLITGDNTPSETINHLADKTYQWLHEHEYPYGYANLVMYYIFNNWMAVLETYYEEIEADVIGGKR